MRPLTPTAIKAANRCPLAFHRTYTDKATKSRPTPNEWRGIAVHRALQALARQRMAGEPLDVAAAVGDDKNRVASLLRAAIERGLLADMPALLEQPLRGDVEGVAVEARADRIDGDAVVEYKTGGSIADHDRVQAGILARLSGKPCRIVVLEPWTVETVHDSPHVDAAVAEADRVRSAGDRTARPGDHCAKCAVRESCPARVLRA